MGITVGERADDEEVAIAKVLGEAGELPAMKVKGSVPLIYSV